MSKINIPAATWNSWVGVWHHWRTLHMPPRGQLLWQPTLHAHTHRHTHNTCRDLLSRERAREMYIVSPGSLCCWLWPLAMEGCSPRIVFVIFPEWFWCLLKLFRSQPTCRAFFTPRSTHLNLVVSLGRMSWTLHSDTVPAFCTQRRYMILYYIPMSE